MKMHWSLSVKQIQLKNILWNSTKETMRPGWNRGYVCMLVYRAWRMVYALLAWSVMFGFMSNARQQPHCSSKIIVSFGTMARSEIINAVLLFIPFHLRACVKRVLMPLQTCKNYIFLDKKTNIGLITIISDVIVVNFINIYFPMKLFVFILFSLFVRISNRHNFCTIIAGLLWRLLISILLLFLNNYIYRHRNCQPFDI